MTSSVDLMLGDCLDLLKEIPDRSVDLVLADPPYGIHTTIDWDKNLPFEKIWPELGRITKEKSPIVLMSVQPFTTDLINSNREWFRYQHIWDKHIPRGMHQAKNQPMRRHEEINVFSKTYPHNYYPIMVERDKPVKVRNYSRKTNTTNGKYKEDQSNKWYTYTHKHPDSIITGCWEANKGKIHPTQKPVSLMEYLIQTYTQPGEMVLDFCFGSASTIVAAVNTGRRVIGMEKDPEYFSAGSSRVDLALIKNSEEDNGGN